MASAPQPQRKPTEVDSTPAGRHARRRTRAITLIVIGALVFAVSAGVLLNSLQGGTQSAGGVPVEAPAPPGESAYLDRDDDEGFDAPLAESQGANGAPPAPPALVTLADAESELTAIAETLADEPAFSEPLIAALSDVADAVTASLDDAIDQGATEVIRLLERADETLDGIRSAAEPGAPAPGTTSEVRAAATLVAAADDAWPEPPTPDPTVTPHPTPPPPSPVELDDYIAMAGAAGGLLTAAAGVMTAVSEWRRTRRIRAASGSATVRAGAPTPSSDLEETIRPS